MLVVVNLEDGVPPNLVPDVPLAELDQRGEYELIRVLFPVWNMTPEQAAGGSAAAAWPAGQSRSRCRRRRQIQVTETGGRLRTIRSVVNAVEQPELGTAGMREFALKYHDVRRGDADDPPNARHSGRGVQHAGRLGANHQERDGREDCSSAAPPSRPRD